MQRYICEHEEKVQDNDQTQVVATSDERNKIHEDNLLLLSLRDKNVENEQISSVFRLYIFPKINFCDRERPCQQL